VIVWVVIKPNISVFLFVRRESGVNPTSSAHLPGRAVQGQAPSIHQNPEARPIEDYEPKAKSGKAHGWAAILLFSK
jgi:hypothetical protein